MSVKTIDRSRTIHPSVLAALIVVCVLALGVHSAYARINSLGNLRAPAVGGVTGWVLEKQALFYRGLAGMIRSAKMMATRFGVCWESLLLTASFMPPVPAMARR